jgi:hypothetical protein
MWKMRFVEALRGNLCVESGKAVCKWAEAAEPYNRQVSIGGGIPANRAKTFKNRVLAKRRKSLFDVSESWIAFSQVGRSERVEGQKR